MRNMLKLPSLLIKGFRGFRSLKIERLGRVNLIVGKNSSGKSSLLEALRLYACEAHPAVIMEILEARNEVIDLAEGIQLARSKEPVKFPAIWFLFHGYPQDIEDVSIIEIGPVSADRVLKIGVSGPALKDKRAFGKRRWHGISAVIEDRHRIASLDSFSSYLLESEDIFSIPCVSVSRTGTDRFNRVVRLWDRTALTSKESLVEKGLRLLSPQVQRVSFIGEERRLGRIPVVKVEGLEKPLPLRNLGDGVNRVFEIVLAAVNSEDGLLLVDEMENGLHYSIQTQVWEMVFQLARELNIQVFATTHSWDCVKAFQEAAANQKEDGLAIRLTKMDAEVVADIFTPDELAIATRDEIEIR
ncbi:MAG TPA: AAA family ATPase [Planctomycetota bacterium]|nr:AAA family ATPase [Planctomycetota bacterium]